MRPNLKLIGFLATICVICIAAQSTVYAADEYGHTDFHASGSAEAYGVFLQGLLQLHNFEYADARASFQNARHIDSDFVMAWWGEALTWWHPLWPSTDLDAARAILKQMGPTSKARVAMGQTQRERDYLATIETLFAEGDRKSRRFAYSDQLKSLHEKYPDDLDAAAFYALSILAKSDGRKYHYYMQAGAITEEILDRNPLHPGGLHYNIHSYDDTIHAPLGLRAARNYFKVAPSAIHALHMGAHIYYATGNWQLGLERNIDSFEEAVSRMQDPNAPYHPETFHSLHWIPYGFQQIGDHDKAKQYIAKIASQAQQYADVHPMARTVFIETRASYIVDTQDWESELLEQPVDLSNLSEYSVATDHYVRGLSALKLGQIDKARNYLIKIGDPTLPKEGPRTAMGAAILKMALEAQIALVDGEKDKALRLLNQATEIDLDWPAEAGPIKPVQPMAELLADTYLTLGDRRNAKKFYDLTQLYSVGRARTLAGLKKLETGEQ
ncbi:MAG: hypothetical protein AAF438_01130 [Pseudomonadota bacterium]